MPGTSPVRPLPCSALLACLAMAHFVLPQAALSEATYTVDVKLDLQDVDVEVEPVAQSGILVMRLKNKSSVKVRCDLRYDPSPQPIRRTYVFVEPGATAENSLRAKRKWFGVTVDVTCKPA